MQILLLIAEQMCSTQAACQTAVNPPETVPSVPSNWNMISPLCSNYTEDTWSVNSHH